MACASHRQHIRSWSRRRSHRTGHLQSKTYARTGAGAVTQYRTLKKFKKNCEDVAPFRCLAAMPSEGSTMTRIMSSCPSLDRDSRKAEVRSGTITVVIVITMKSTSVLNTDASLPYAYDLFESLIVRINVDNEGICAWLLQSFRDNLKIIQVCHRVGSERCIIVRYELLVLNPERELKVLTGKQIFSWSSRSTKVLHGFLRTWMIDNLKIIQACHRVGSERCIIVRYELLVLNPERELKVLTEFLHVPWDPVMLNHEKLIGNISQLNPVLFAQPREGWKRARGGQALTSQRSIEAITSKLSCAGHCRLPGWGPRDGPH
ncbi:hypothetical protein T265_12023 [Opisthorchis viverrini]|uniref:Protein-tyrosine sulfotransferase n=1 Tax=Opisthorchis viverrini TaxID=6198 RepID=A0A074Z785_OPIVI|nr:hypothetical protein T265_12023 [Opisthorchis viverrini]KER19075.1 hypothetical protein T265_12023 [Opisthorchis viverrini]